MTITWLGHAAFCIQSESGITIITDPYEAGSYDGALAYAPIEEEADIVTVSHQHADHYHPRGLVGHPDILTGTGTRTIGQLTFKGIPSFHDPSNGTERGENTIFVFDVDGITICHLGDLGHLLSDEQLAEIGHIDVVFIPVGGLYTINAAEATEIVERLAPGIVIPMHFKTASCAFPIAPVDDFLSEKKNVDLLDSSELFMTKDLVPSETHIKVLEHKL